MLIVATLLVAVMSEFLVGAVEEASRTLGLTEVFAGVISVAIGGLVLAVALIAHDGKSNWMKGVLLLAVYTILGLTFYVLPG